MKNARNYVKANNIPLWRVARHIGVSESTLSAWLREPLDLSREIQIIRACDELLYAQSHRERTNRK